LQPQQLLEPQLSQQPLTSLSQPQDDEAVSPL
jgi:hypothetical protein